MPEARPERAALERGRAVGRHSADKGVRKTRRVAVGIVVLAVLVATGVSAAVATNKLGSRKVDGGSSGRGSASPSAQTCSRELSIVVASSLQPVLAKVGSSLAAGADCVRLRSTVADGAAAVTLVEKDAPDAWIADDASWRNLASGNLFTGAAVTVLATSPIYALLPKGAALPSSATTWGGLSSALSKKGALRLALADPAVSGPSMVAAGALSLAVYDKSGPLISALNLMRTWQVATTSAGPGLALPKSGQVGFATEQEIGQGETADDYTVLAMKDQTALQRVAWSESKAAAADPGRSAAAHRLLTALTSTAGVKAFAAAGFRGVGEDASAPSSSEYKLPATSGDPFPVIPEHFMFHVLTTWHPQRRQADILVVVDVSGSMADPAPGTDQSLISLVSAGVGQLESLLPDNSRVGLWEFGSELSPPNDYRVLVHTHALSTSQRGKLRTAARGLHAQPTGTGLYDTILAAYRAQQAAYTSSMPMEVLVFTDGRDQDDPDAISLTKLRKSLAATNKAKHVQIGVLGFGRHLPATALASALAPVDGQVDTLTTAQDVIGAFVHAVSGGLTH